MAELHTSIQNILKRVPPSKVPETLEMVSSLKEEDISYQFKKKISEPLVISVNEQTGNKYIQCRFNRTSLGFRPPLSEGLDMMIPSNELPSGTLRHLEILANEIFEDYIKLYYSEAVKSVYFKDTHSNDFSCAFLIKNELRPKKMVVSGSWESAHYIDAELSMDSRLVAYSVSSTAYFQVKLAGNTEISGRLSKEVKESRTLEEDYFGEPHIHNIISIIENTENYLRNSLENIYMWKAKVILDQTRKAAQKGSNPIQLPAFPS